MASDEFWKDAIEAYFKDFMELFWPVAHGDIDWSQPVVWRDKELQKLLPDNVNGKRFVDKLVEVNCTKGDRALVLVHIEVQSSKDVTFSKRMFTYHYRIRDRYDCPVFSCAVLADGNPSWRPSSWYDEIWGCGIRMEFPVVKLLDWRDRWDELSASKNPMGMLIQALLTVQATSRDLPARSQWKLAAVFQLYEKGYGRAEVRRLFRFIDWVVELPEELSRQFEQALIETERTRKMPYITTIERSGIRKGKELGLKKGKELGRLEVAKESIVDALEVRFGSVTPELRTRIGQLTDVEACKALHKQAISAMTLGEFIQLLEFSGNTD
ncbi:MAG: hypothetical protein RIE53_10140 [Rhodothermales bacterium]